MAQLVVLRPDDEVAIALEGLNTGADAVSSDGGTLRITTEVPRGHKVARVPIAIGTPVHKYGEVIGVATADIPAGAHVHTQNLAMSNAAHTRTLGGAAVALPTPPGPRPTFAGYRRSSGKVGTRNYVAIITSVNCAASTAALIAEHFDAAALAPYPNVDGVIAIKHTSGCGLVPDSEGGAILLRTLQGFASHPNIGAVLMVGLGCEMVSCGWVLDQTRLSADVTYDTMLIQDLGGVQATVAAGITRVQELIVDLNERSHRVPCDVSELVLGMNCGGSDGFSGLSANPALGVASDLIVSYGGTSILGETPEIFGAEHLLSARAIRPDIAERLYARLEWWQHYAAAGSGTLDNNPSPGNKAGGITTILEKSLGAVAKGGRAPLAEFVPYAAQVDTPGLVFMDTPGYDPVSVTGIVAGGATLVVFTTGRGSVLGFKPAPVIKVSSNSQLYARMGPDIDLNAGVIADGTASVAEVGRELFDLILQVASGVPSASEALGIGAEEFVPWHIGAVT